MVTRRDYTAEAVEAARSVLVELVRLLGGYRNEVVLVGGWVPEFLLRNPEAPHFGSVASVDIESVAADAAAKVCRGIILGHYRARGKNPPGVLGWAADFPKSIILARPPTYSYLPTELQGDRGCDWSTGSEVDREKFLKSVKNESVPFFGYRPMRLLS